MMVDQPFPASEGLIDNALLIVPSYAKDKNLNVEKLQKTCKSFEIRTLPVINVSLVIVDEKYGFLFFPEEIPGKIDYNYAFYVTDNMGLDFLLRMWDYFWKKAKLRISSSQLL